MNLLLPAAHLVSFGVDTDLNTNIKHLKTSEEHSKICQNEKRTKGFRKNLFYVFLNGL